ncbi:type II toxin-antitoxin system RelE/ParE family toxin [Erwinia persicina]|uniref:type II toxin-antitoxin system RelE/ParE family toxin n=1 Tax=Erwinia persicina TaxID=55211 RepID=UPI00178175DC|nr:type II toxin-antitoxin system RelE/ParE family toxin [Erwinia persicina]MBD8170373.1 type II toxin-antitoxin system RelE/ParE family toxin [Erwinia persicina]
MNEDEDEVEVYVVSAFSEKAQKEAVSDDSLLKAAEEIVNGLIDANLSGSLVKKRIASGNRNTGRSDGNRAIVSIKRGKKLFYLYLFSKKEKDNITKKELKALKEFGELMFSYSDEQLNDMVSKGVLRKL